MIVLLSFFCSEQEIAVKKLQLNFPVSEVNKHKWRFILMGEASEFAHKLYHVLFLPSDQIYLPKRGMT